MAVLMGEVLAAAGGFVAEAGALKDEVRTRVGAVFEAGLAF